MKQQPRKKLPWQEWDFLPGVVPANELRFCFYWEYLRQPPWVRDYYSQISRADRENESVMMGVFSAMSEAANFLTADTIAGEIPSEKSIPLFVYPIVTHALFPNTPWLLVPKDQRASIVKEYLDAKRGTIEFRFGLALEELEQFVRWRNNIGQTLSTPESVGIFRIPVGMSVEDIIDAFEHELREFAGKNSQDFVWGFQKSRGQYGDMLRQLGAFRITKLVGDKEAANYVKIHASTGDPLYRATKELKNAVDKALETLNVIFPNRGNSL